MYAGLDGNYNHFFCHYLYSKCVHGKILYNMSYIYLVGCIPTPLQNIKVSWDDEIPNIWKNKKCSNLPTSISIDNGICWECIGNIWKIWESISYRYL